MVRIGYALSSEEHGPSDLVHYAQRAEEAGFSFALVSDHYHPWMEQQGHSPFVWSVLGAIAQATDTLQIGTGVVCPTVRIHPAIVAQAAATTAAMMPGRFFLGVGTGEYLNEHILGDHWPPYDVRLEMLEESLEIIRLLWQGDMVSYYGCYYVVENARLYTLPDLLPKIMVAASGSKSADFAGRAGDGLIGVAPDKGLLEEFAAAGGGDKPRYGQLAVCYAEDREEAVRTALKYWPNAAIKGQAGSDLPLPLHFEQLAAMVRKEDIEKFVVCGPDPEQHMGKIREYADAGYDHIYVHQVGPKQEAFFRFYQREIMPVFS